MRGFTLLELMVVILIIGVLSAILTPVLMKARERAKVRWAQKELNELGAVISLYHRDHSAYPPDTQDWSAKGGNSEDPDKPSHDELSIHRYLGSRIFNWKGEEFRPYMSMDWKRLGDVDDDGIGRFRDPFETAYELDSMHMIPPNPDDPLTTYAACGWPYVLEKPGAPIDDERQRMVLDYKFISYGPDTLTTEGSYPFATGKVMDRPAPRTGLARDDVCSWE